MNEPKTISDSKRAFHQAFPFVIPPIYRGVADELLVELHLLSHQKEFKVDGIFAVGLTQVFSRFMRGYKPDRHLNGLFEALCKSNSMDPLEIKSQSKRILEEVSNYKFKEVESSLIARNKQDQGQSGDIIKSLKSINKHYSRLTPIGIFSILSTTNDIKDIDKEKLSNASQSICESLGFSASRVEKDLSLYNSNLEKLSQALELLEETISSQRKKNEQATAKKLEEDGPSENNTKVVEA